MRRLLSSIALASVVGLALAGPAFAWDSVNITISAPTGAGTTSNGDPGGPPVSGTSGEVIDMLLVSSSMDRRPAGDLGPRFEITYTFPGGSLSQDLYPYAAGGPVAFSASDGSIVGHRVQAGWHEGNAAMLQRFVSWGLPPSPNGLTVEPAGDAGSTSAAEDTLASTERTAMVALAGLLGLAVVLLIGRQRRGAMRHLAA